ncbi:uncharacterized protein LOC128385632 isoform X1 [Panonychus citri]|uniref:uncharacterized protein LOC128385632 isoform X1 n=1 Tax=Panonychus citri TaxID=50023 RepID=UPI00230791FA|nr:uncharacterized protein LOC128385632 isoform X1 [Panonychus citri]
MSSDETNINRNQTGEGSGDAGGGLGSPPLTSPTTSTSKSTINLTTLDKIKRFFFSKEEWEAYLMEKLEEQEKKKGGDITLETKSDSTTKKNVVSWLKTVFPSQEDANSFLKLQIDKMQEGQQSTPTSPQAINENINSPTTSNNQLITLSSSKETEKASSSSSKVSKKDNKQSS